MFVPRLQYSTDNVHPVSNYSEGKQEFQKETKMNNIPRTENRLQPKKQTKMPIQFIITQLPPATAWL